MMASFLFLKAFTKLPIGVLKSVQILSYVVQSLMLVLQIGSLINWDVLS